MRRCQRAILALIVAALTLAGCGGGTHKTPRPPLPAGQSVTSCGTTGNHTMGQCLPKPVLRFGGVHRPKFLAGASIIGVDRSNNDPTSGWAAISARLRFAYLKSVEGTGYYDSTASYMAEGARAHRLPVGGYDFLHVCSSSGYAEAAFFVRALRAQRLLGSGSLPPAGDAEAGGGCSGWVQQWVNAVYSLDGHVCPIMYTGAWWWQPNLGSYWPTCQGKQILSWISGYGVAYPYMPSGLGHLDFWQWTDHGYDGVSNVDLETWMHSPAGFAQFANQTPPTPPDPYAIYPQQQFLLLHGVKASEYFTVRTWDRAGCKSPPVRYVCRTSHLHLRYLRDRLYTVAHQGQNGGPFVLPAHWGEYHRGARYQGLSRRLR